MRRNDQPTSVNTATLDERILEIFRSRDGGVVSGEELSQVLNVSRTAVWKHIKSLQNVGYRIAAVPSLGYRLVATPDIFVPAEIAAGLHTQRIGREIICYTEIDSTNTISYKLAEEGAADGTVVLADHQRAGKGRLGRSWESPAGVNLYCSVILRPAIVPMVAYQLTFLSAVAVARAVAGSTTLVPQIKWPNDILINGRKVAGLLNEMSAETEKVHFIVLGIGVNLNMGRELFPADLRHPATSLFLESGERVDRTAFTRELLAALDILYDDYLRFGYAPIREEWLTRCHMLGRKVSVTMQDRVIIGEVTGIDENGALLVRMSSGREERILSGDVSFCE